MKKIILILLFLPSTLLPAQQPEWLAPDDQVLRKNPMVVSPETREQGKSLYIKFCSPCHGTSGKGDGPAAVALNPPPADHTSAKVQKETDGSLFWKISEGRGTMPSWKVNLTEEERWKIIHFIRSLESGTDTTSLKETKATTDTATVLISPAEEAGSECASGCVDPKELEGKRFLATGSANAISMLDMENMHDFQFGFGFLPIFLWKPSEKLFVESHFHIEGGNTEASGHSHDGTTPSKFSEASISIAFVNLVYFVSKHIAISAGYFPTPFGIYNERMHPDWINKLPDAPLGTGHHSSLGPSTELGAQVRGDLPLRKLRVNYTVYVSNGPQLDYTSEEAGKLQYGSVTDNNGNKALGGRIGILPFHRSTVEVGFSAQTAKCGDVGTRYEDVSAKMYCADLSFNEIVKSFRGAISLKSQYTYVQVGNTMYTILPNARSANSTFQHSADTITYYFVNTSHAGFAQLSYRPSLSRKKFLKNLEFVGRFDEIALPENAIWTMNDLRWTVGFDYWLEARSVIKLALEIGEYKNLAMVQFVIGF